MTDLFAYAEQCRAGEIGMALAADRAERHIAGWQDRAVEFLGRYATSTPFLIERAAEWAHKHGLESPPDPRAWGAAVKRASRQGIIVKTGEVARNELSGHGSRVSPLWVAP